MALKRRVEIPIDGDPKGFDRAAKQVAASAAAADRQVTKLEQRNKRAWSAMGRDSNRSASLMRGELASLVAGAAAVAPAAVTAGAGFVAFAAVAAPALLGVVRAQTEMAEAWGTLSAGQKLAAVELMAFTDEARRFAREFEPQVLEIFNTALDTTRTLMADLRPTTAATTAAMQRFADKTQKALAGPEWQEFFDFAEAEAGPTIDALGTAMLDLAETVTDLVIALNPLAKVVIPAVGGMARLLGAVAETHPELIQLAVAAIALRAPLGAASRLMQSLTAATIAQAQSSGVAATAMTRLGQVAAVAGLAILVKRLTDAATAADRFAEAAAARGGPTIEGQIRALNEELRIQEQLTSKGANLFNTFYTHNAARDAANNVDAIRAKLTELRHTRELDQIQAATEAQAQRRLGEAMRSGAMSADQLKQALDAITGANVGYVQARIDFLAATHAATAAVKQNGRTLNLNTERGRANMQALIDLSAKSREYVVAAKQQGRSQEEVNAIAGDARRRFVAVARSMGANSKEANRLADQILGIPRRWHTRYTTPGATAAIGRFRAIQAAIRNIPLHRTVTIGVQQFTVRGPGLQPRSPFQVRADGGIDRYAHGGVRPPAHIARRRTVLFGEPETGGEAFIPLSPSKRARSTAILSQVADEFGLAVGRRVRGPASAGAAGGRPVQLIFNVPATAHPAELGRTVVRAIQEYERGNGPGWRS